MLMVLCHTLLHGLLKVKTQFTMQCFDGLASAAALARLKTIWKDKNIRIKNKTRLMRALVITIFLYACET